MTPSPMDDDPLWRMRHALAGVALSLLASVLLAALAGSAIGDAGGGGYGTRLVVYLVLLAYVVAGAVTLFVKVARHETQRLTLTRLGRWLASLWLWPLLLLASARR
ncbi:MAG: hypothetical protein ABIN96_12115 [Rubrivivax sp.]